MVYVLRAACAVVFTEAHLYAAPPPQTGARLRPVRNDGERGYAGRAGGLVIAPPSSALTGTPTAASSPDSMSDDRMPGR